jgi:magnesium-transporting ATPase (P-type)
MTAFFFFYWINGYRGQWLDLPSSGDLYRGATAMALAAVVTTQIGNLFAQRTGSVSLFKTNIFKNRLIWIGIATEVLLIFMLIYIPFLQHIFGTAAFPLKNWGFLFAWAPSLLIADEIRKMLARRKDKTILGGDI